jgi:hypothetical protein
MLLDPLVEGQSEGVVVFVVAAVAGDAHKMDLCRDGVVPPGNMVAFLTTVHGEVDDRNVLVKTGRPVGGVAILTMHILYHVSYLNSFHSIFLQGHDALYARGANKQQNQKHNNRSIDSVQQGIPPPPPGPSPSRPGMGSSSSISASSQFRRSSRSNQGGG